MEILGVDIRGLGIKGASVELATAALTAGRYRPPPESPCHARFAILCRKGHDMQTYKLMWGGVLMIAVVAWMACGTSPALAQQARVPRTGQTTCLDAAGSPINCTGTGQDGASQAGMPSPNPRFSDTKHGTVKDNLTNLIWLKNADCFGLQTWANALNAANTLASGACSLTDGSVAGNWRVPNVRELGSLIDFGTFNPALPSGHPFSGVQPAVYWSSTTIADDPGLAWGVSLVVGSPRPIGKADTGRVWLVRGGD
jgi:Protein of unknown function (DUF1566)